MILRKTLNISFVILFINCSFSHNEQLINNRVEGFWHFHTEELGYTEVLFVENKNYVFSKQFNKYENNESWCFDNDSIYVFRQGDTVNTFKILNRSDSALCYLLKSEKICMEKFQGDSLISKSIDFGSDQYNLFLRGFFNRMNEFYRARNMNNMIIDSSSTDTILIKID